jgi:hypothetical protein
LEHRYIFFQRVLLYPTPQEGTKIDSGLLVGRDKFPSPPEQGMVLGSGDDGKARAAWT